MIDAPRSMPRRVVGRKDERLGGNRLLEIELERVPRALLRRTSFELDLVAPARAAATVEDQAVGVRDSAGAGDPEPTALAESHRVPLGMLDGFALVVDDADGE